MPSRADHRPGDEEEFQLTIEVPRDIRHDPELLQDWLNTLSVELLNAKEITFDQDPSDAGPADTEGVKVTLSVRPCGGRFPDSVTGPIDPEDFDTPGPGGVVQS